MSVRVVGRDAELRLLADWWADVDDLGSAVLLHGAPGVGRTSLVRAFLDGVGEPHALVSPAPGVGASPYAHLHRLLRRSGRPGLPTEPLADPDADPLDLVIGQLVSAPEAARLLVVDDVHNLDPESARLLVSLVAELGATSVGLLLTAPSASGPVDDLAALVRLVELGGLSRGDLDLLAPSGLSDRARATAFEASAGNPSWALELFRAWTADALDSDAPPPGFAALVRRRAAALPPDVRQVVDVVSVAGEADTALVADIVQLVDDGRGRTAIDDALRTGLVVTDGAAVLRPPHPLIAESLRTALPLGTRAHLHKRVAASLRARPSSSLSSIAMHLVAAAPAGSAAEAVEACSAATAAALRIRAYDDAVRWSGEAVRLAPMLGADAPVAALRMAHGDALARCGDDPAARAQYLAAAAHAAEHEDWTAYAEAALKVGSHDGFEIAADDAEQLALLSTALENVAASDPLRARLLARQSVASWATAPPQLRERRAREAVALAERAGDGLATFDALAALHDAIAGPAGLAERDRIVDRMLAVALTHRDPLRELLARRMRVVLRLEQGRLDEAPDEIGGFDDRARGLSLPLYSFYPPLWRACLRWAMDDRGGAEVLLRTAGALGDRAGSGNAAILVGGSSFFGRLDSGEPWDPTETLAPLLGPSAIEALWVTVTRAYARAAMGDDAAAAALLEPALSSLPDLVEDSEYLPTLTQAALAIAWSGMDAAASVRRVYEMLLPYRGQFVVEGIGAYTHGSVERILAVLARLDGRAHDATDHVRRARSAHARVGAARLLRLVDETEAGPSSGDGLTEAGGSVRQACLRPVDDRRWQVGFLGSTGLVRDAKGMHDLAALLATPRQPIGAWILAAGPGAGERPWDSDLGETLDQTARSAYRRRLEELDEELSRADLVGDEGASARTYAERAQIVEELRRATDRHGRPRRGGDAVERARSTVTVRIRDSIRRIAAVDPALAEHLQRSVVTGRECVYDPEIVVVWQLG